MAGQKIFARVTPYYMSQEVLSRCGDGTGNSGFYKRTQTVLGDVKSEIDFSNLEGVIEGTSIELIEGQKVTILVGTDEQCHLRLPDYLDYVGAQCSGVQAELRFNGKALLIETKPARFDNRINGQGFSRGDVYKANPTQNPTIVTLADSFMSEQQQTQAILKIVYKQ